MQGTGSHPREEENMGTAGNQGDGSLVGTGEEVEGSVCGLMK